MKTLIVAAALLLSSCVTETHWTKPGASQAMLATDTAQCKYETDRVTATMENAVHAGIEDSLLNKSCMQARGWTR
jgi:hypothetical protein